MYRKWILIIVFIFGILLSNGKTALAVKDIASLHNDHVRILFIYSTKQQKVTPNVNKLDILLHHFTKYVSITSEAELTKNDMQAVTHLFYYGEDKQSLREQTIQLIDEFSGKIIVIGENIEQIPAFHGFEVESEVRINGISFEQIKGKRNLQGNVRANQLDETSDLQILLYGYIGLDPVPIMTQKDDLFYLAVTKIEDMTLTYFAEILHDIIPNHHKKEYLAYIRLENIHPLTEPEKVLEAGELLNKRNIPYILVVKPVYKNSETGEQVHLADAKELIEVLQYLQGKNGTIISNGYANEFQSGYEFWDVEYDQFITKATFQEERQHIFGSGDFPNEKEYEVYMETLQEQEKAYITQRVESSITELVKEDLYPLAFTAPFDAISQQGYRIVSDSFSSMFGQVQLTDDTFHSMYAPPYITTGSLLHGLTIYPDTIGDVTNFTANSDASTFEKLDQALIVRDSVIGVRYQAYLGANYMERFLKQLETIPNINWLDLQNTEQSVRTQKIQLESDEMAPIVVTNELTWQDEWQEKVKQVTLFEKILWAVTFLVFIFVSLFIIIALYLRLQLKKRLFRERK